MEEKKFDSTKKYVSASDKYENLTSSAFSLILVGCIGFIFLILQLTGIINIPFNASARIFIYTLWFLLFAFFIIGGIFSYKSAAKLKPLIKKETDITEQVSSWIKETLTPLYVDVKCPFYTDTEETVDEEKYLQRISIMKEAVFAQFADYDSALLENITEDCYTKIYEE